MSNTKKTNWEAVTKAWSLQDDAKRKSALESASINSCTYEAPGVSTDSIESLVAAMKGFQEQVPGGKFVINDYCELSDSSIAVWDMQLPDGTVVASGVSHGIYDGADKLVSMKAYYNA